jgi:hypothetical protein
MNEAMKLSKQRWQPPRVSKLSVRETRNTNGDDSDTGAIGGIFLVDPVGKPTEMSIPADDVTRVLDFLRSISSSPEKLEEAIFKPEEAMANAGLTSKGIKIAKRVLTYLGS